MSRWGLRAENKGLALIPGKACHSHIEEAAAFLRLVITRYDYINIKTFSNSKYS